MGRAQGTLDLFTSVLGERRGSKATYKVDSAEMTEREKALVQWMTTHETESGWFYHGDACFDCPLYKEGVYRSTNCWGDFEALYRKGICQKKNFKFILKPFREWPESCWLSYRDWIKNGSPGGV